MNVLLAKAAKGTPIDVVRKIFGNANAQLKGKNQSFGSSST
jgi:hypothetical protein